MTTPHIGTSTAYGNQKSRASFTPQQQAVMDAGGNVAGYAVVDGHFTYVGAGRTGEAARAAVYGGGTAPAAPADPNAGYDPSLLGRPPLEANVQPVTSGVGGDPVTNDSRALDAVNTFIQQQNAKDQQDQQGRRDDAFAQVSQILSQYGLDSLSGTVREWAQQDLSASEIALKVYDTPEFKNEYGSVMDARKNAGLPAVSVSDILGYRKHAAELFQAAGLPQGFHDDKSDYDKFIAGDVSLSELSDRINGAAQAMYQAPQEERDAFAEWGVTPGDLVAFWLNPDRALPLLQQKETAAKLAGVSRRTGFGSLSEAQATTLAQQGVTQDQAQAGFTQLQQGQELFGALDAGEQSFTRDEQIGATFGSNPNAARRIEQQRRRRQAQYEQGGQFSAQNTGISGLASAPR